MAGFARVQKVVATPFRIESTGRTSRVEGTVYAHSKVLIYCLMASGWGVPPGLKGDPALFRVSATLAADDEWSCGMRSAVKARPGW